MSLIKTFKDIREYNKKHINKKIYYISTVLIVLVILLSNYNRFLKPQAISNATIALIDTGLNEKDININFKRYNNINPKQYDENYGIYSGYNVIDNSEDINDEHGHGTTIISSLFDKTSPLVLRSNFMMIKAFDKDGIAKSKYISKAINYACSNNINILNMSFSLNSRNDDVEREVKTCIEKGIVVVASSGLDNSKVSFPANIEGVISVASKHEGLKAKNNKDINVFIDMNNAIYCLKDKCDLTYTNSIATAYTSAIISDLFSKADYKMINRLKKESFDINMSYLYQYNINKIYE